MEKFLFLQFQQHFTSRTSSLFSIANCFFYSFFYNYHLILHLILTSHSSFHSNSHFLQFYSFITSFFQLQQQHKHQEVLFLEKETAVAEAISLREKLAAKETEIQRESKRRQKTHLELMDVR